MNLDVNTFRGLTNLEVIDFDSNWVIIHIRHKCVMCRRFNELEFKLKKFYKAFGSGCQSL